MARVLGLDFGERRIGVAVSDPEKRFAVPLRIVERRGDDTDIETISDIARAEDVETLVVGNPLSLSGASGSQARLVQAFARKLAHAAGLPLVLWDERLSSAQAERAARPVRRGRRTEGRRPQRQATDDVAAALILQSYLDRTRSTRSPASEP